ncbi:MAG: Glycosyltransferase/rhamnosyltransferase [Parcubacteria group bacterium GW2011_GWA2_51_12]|nr:MAG: Glycosyltransferase/rhamnosyltransferase [Parcubacteria group bacterium GW2011_GWA2_51_12]
MDISVIIVSYNTKDKLRLCLASVTQSSGVVFEVFVVDNASSDGSPEMVREEFPSVALVRNRTNIGYAKANNQAIASSRGRYVLLLNPDVEVRPDTMSKMMAYMDEHPDVGISGCKVLKIDGKLDLACRRSFPTPASSLFRVTGLSFLFPKSRFASYNLTYLPEDEIAEVDSVMGAFLLISRLVIEKIGLLDETFFMYGEDIDWCFRAKEAGFKVMYAPITTVTHDKGSSSRKVSRKALYEFHKAMQIFYDKHYRRRYNFAVGWFVSGGIWGRYCLKIVQNAVRSEKFVSK